MKYKYTTIDPQDEKIGQWCGGKDGTPGSHRVPQLNWHCLLATTWQLQRQTSWFWEKPQRKNANSPIGSSWLFSLWPLPLWKSFLKKPKSWTRATWLWDPSFGVALENANPNHGPFCSQVYFPHFFPSINFCFYTHTKFVCFICWTWDKNRSC